MLKPLAPIVADPVCKDRPVSVEIGACDGATYRRIALESMMCVLVPEVERPIRPGGAERSMDRMERYGVDGVHIDHVVRRRVTMAAEGEVKAVSEKLASAAGNAWCQGS